MKKILTAAILFAQLISYGQTGINTTTPKSKLDINGSIGLPIKTISADYTLLDTDYSIVTANTADIYITLPAAASVPNRTYHILNGSNFKLFFNSPMLYVPAQGGVTNTISAKQDCQIQSDGTNWVLTILDRGAATDNAWGLTGNSGTTIGTNFIGTTDNKDLVFKRNNIQSGLLSNTNTSFGVNALSSNVSGSSNAAFGQGAQAGTTGSNNLALGTGAQAGTTGSNNIAIGTTASVQNADLSNQMNIGSVIFGTGMTGSSLAPAGNIGIGTAAPSATLHLKNTTSTALRVEDGTQGAGKILTSDANGNASWQSNSVPSVFGNLTSAINTFTNANLNFVSASPATSYNNTTSIYTGSTITLPPGKWLVNVNMLLSKSANVYQNSGYDAWITATFSDSSTSLNMSMSDFAGTNKIAGGSMISTIGCTMMNGNIVLQNSTASNKTYYFWLRGVILYNATATYNAFQMQYFGTNNFGENQIVAYRIQ